MADERSETRRALVLGVEQLRSIFDKATDMIAVVQNGRIVAANPSMASFLGRDQEALVGVDFQELLHPDDRERVSRVHLARQEGKEVPDRYVVKSARHDGEIRYLEMNGSSFEWGGEPATLGFLRDVTDQKSTERDLETARDEARQYLQELEQTLKAQRRAEQLFSYYVDSINAFVYMKDTTGRYTFVNRKTEVLFGVKRDDLEKKRYTNFDFFDEKMARSVEENDRRILETGEFMEMEEVGYVVGSGREGRQKRYYLSLKFPLRNDEGETIGTCGFSLDITDQKKAEASRRELEEQLLQAQKMEAIGQLAGGVAHDFNNTLAGIIIFAEMLHRDLEEGDARREDVRQITEAARRAKDLTGKLLAFGRRQILEMHTVDLNAVVEGLGDMLRRTIPESIEISLKPWQKPVLFEGDKGQIEQVILNLVVNARDAMPDGGKLEISVSPYLVDREFAARNPGLLAGPHARLSVIDDGKGMDRETVDRAFDPFFTTKDPGEGTGLGLSTAHGIVKQHSGEIEVHSEKGAGTRFDLYFPAVGGRPSTSADDRRGDIPTGDETLLVVEDNPVVRSSTCRVLEKLGYRVLSAASGPKALELVDGEASKENISLLLTDVIMPVMNGREVHEALERRGKEITVLFMSGYTGEVIAKHGVLDRGVNFLQKPFSLEELARKIRDAIEKSG